MLSDNGLWIPQETLNKIGEEYPVGSRVRLLEMDDKYAPPVGTLGTVRSVDDTGTIHVAWDNGSGLGVVYNVDKCERIDKEKSHESADKNQRDDYNER